MKTVGFAVSFLCLLVAQVITWAGYVSLFDETNIIPAFESDPREGWDYWLQREYWHDLQWFTAYLLTAILCVGIPVIGRILDGRPIRVRPVLDVTLAAIASVYPPVSKNSASVEANCRGILLQQGADRHDAGFFAIFQTFTKGESWK